MTFGQFIRQKRKSLNLIQEDLAEYLDCSQKMISLLELDKRTWTLEHILILAAMFDMEAWELVREWCQS